MTTRDLLHKVCTGVATLTMAVTFINCNPDTGGVGGGPTPTTVQPQSLWCTEVSDGELYGFWVVAPEVPFTIVSTLPPIELGTRRACACVPSEVDDLIADHYGPGDSHGDDVSIPDNAENEARIFRDHLHFAARAGCFQKAIKHIQDQFVELTEDLIEYPDDVMPWTTIAAEYLSQDTVFTNCFGHDPDFIDDYDIIQGDHPIFRLADQCSDDPHMSVREGQDSLQMDALMTSLNPSSSVVQATYVLNRDEVASWADRLEELMAKGIEIAWDEETERFQVLNPQRDPLLDAIGMKHRDLIMTVDGKDMRTARDGMNAFAAAGNAAEIRIGLVRDGMPRMHTYVWEATR